MNLHNRNHDPTGRVVTIAIEFELILVAIRSYQSSIAERKDRFLNMRLETGPMRDNLA